MRYRFLAGIFLATLGAVIAQPLRTPDGQLWAGTTFQLRASASLSGRVVAISAPAQVSVGQVAQWTLRYESSPLLSTAGEDWFVVALTNRGNGVDTLSLKLPVEEGPDTTPWQRALFMQTEPGRTFSQATPVTDFSAPVAPGEVGRFFIRVRPPSDRNTDGIFLNFAATSLANPQVNHSAPMAAGNNTTIGTQISYTTSTGSPILVSPYLIEGRLWWIQQSGTIARVMSTPQPINQAGTFSNNVRSEARIFEFAPSKNNAIVSGRWFIVSQQGELGILFMNLLTGDARIFPHQINLPQEFRLNPQVPIVGLANTLYYVDQSGRVCMLDPISWIVSVVPPTSDSPVVALKPLRNGDLLTARANGRFDILRGSSPVWANLRLPNSNAQPVLGADYSQNGTYLFVCAPNALSAWNTQRRKWDWRWSPSTPLVSEPLYSPELDAVLVVDAEGVLHAFDSASGNPLPIYPQPVFEKVSLERAHLKIITRQDRGVPYVYVAGQANDGKACISLVTLFNPLNRFRFESPASADLGESLIHTGDGNNDFLFGWVYRGGAGDSERGAFYGFRLR
ncbi:MAG: hypothetical protein SNJ72_01595 [Fimbriimonadales bacterium]